MFNFGFDFTKEINKAGQEYADEIEKAYRHPKTCRCGHLVCRHQTCQCMKDKQKETQKERQN